MSVTRNQKGDADVQVRSISFQSDRYVNYMVAVMKGILCYKYFIDHMDPVQYSYALYSIVLLLHVADVKDCYTSNDVSLLPALTRAACILPVCVPPRSVDEEAKGMHGDTYPRKWGTVTTFKLNVIQLPPKGLHSSFYLPAV